MDIRTRIKCRWLSARITSTVFFADILSEKNPEFTRWQIIKRNALAAILFASLSEMPIKVKIKAHP